MTKIEKLWKFMKKKKIDKGWNYEGPYIDYAYFAEEEFPYIWYVNIIEQDEEVMLLAEFGAYHLLIEERFIRQHVEDINACLKTSYTIEELLNKINGGESYSSDFFDNLETSYHEIRDKEEGLEWHLYCKPLISAIQEENVSPYTDLGYININYPVSKIVSNLKRYIGELTELLEKEDETIDKDVIYQNIKDNSTKLDIKENKSGGFSIYPVDNKDISIIRFEKLDENKEEYKFIVEIKDRDKFEYETTIKTKEDLNKSIDFVIGSFNSHPIFSKYTDDIENLKLL